jgi:protein-tyrosine phosphatase
VRTVLDMRWPEEAAQHPSPVVAALPGVRYARISLLMLSETEWRLRAHEGAKELWKCMVLERARPEVRQVLSFIAAASPAPLLFHCVAGKDRTGLIAALLLALAGVTPEAISRDYALSTQNLREAYLRRYPSHDPERILDALRCPEEGAHNMLQYLEAAGGIRAYLASIGLSAEEIAQLRARLRL